MRYDEDRVFDVSKPHKTQPQATSKPVIVGHHPIMNDPMVTMDRPTEPPHVDTPATPIKVAVSIQDGNAPPALEEHSAEPDKMEDSDKPSIEVHKAPPSIPAEVPNEPKLPELSEHHPMSVYPQHDLSEPDSVPSDLPPPAANALPATAIQAAQTAAPSALNDLPLPTHHGGHAVKTPRKIRKSPIILLVLLILLGIYGIVDAKTSISLPFHIFRQAAPVTAPVVTPTSARTSTPTPTDPYAGWKTYNDDFATFKYPITWTVARNDNTNLPGSKSLKIDGPSDSAVASTTDVTKGDKASITLNVFGDASTSSAASCKCKVFDVLALSMSQLTTAQLAVTSDIRLGGDPTTPATDLVVTNDNKAIVGATVINDNLAVTTQQLQITGTVDDNNVPDIRISNLTAFMQSRSVQDLIKIINSLSFK